MNWPCLCDCLPCQSPTKTETSLPMAPSLVRETWWGWELAPGGRAVWRPVGGLFHAVPFGLASSGKQKPMDAGGVEQTLAKAEMLGVGREPRDSRERLPGP